MTQTQVRPTREVSRAAAVTLAVVLMACAALAAASALDGRRQAWLGVGIGVAGAAVLALAVARVAYHRWLVVAAAGAVVYFVLSTAPPAVTREAMPLARMGAALAALGVYLWLAMPLGPMPTYGVCCTALAVAAAFFLLWEPPPPKPVPIARPLVDLEDGLLARLPGWKGKHQRLPESVEGALGADEYVNLTLTSASSPYDVLVFATYNANAMTNIPHVPWVCMTQSGYRLVTLRQDEIPHPTKVGMELKPNVILFEAGEGMPPSGALMFQYFNVGGTYEASRQLARIMATSGAIGRRGSYLAQTQVAIYLPQDEVEKAMDRESPPYRLARQVLDTVVALLEQDYYPDLHGSEGG